MSSRNVSEYQQLDEIDHVLLRPEIYIGDINRTDRKVLIIDNDGLKKITTTVAEALEQIFLEVLANAADNVTASREAKLNPIKIEIEVDDEWVKVTNYGLTIPIKKKEGIYIPDLIFGSFRTSSNYDDSKKRTYVGKNGVGAKATNVFSEEFILDCADGNKRYYQRWYNNMKDKEDAVIVKSSKCYTSIAYRADFARFGANEIEDELISIMLFHSIGVSLSANIPVIFNEVEYNMKNILSYVNLTLGADKKSIIHHKTDYYDLAIIDTPSNAMNITFVNGIFVKDGGIHIDEIHKSLLNAVKTKLGKKGEGVRFTKRDIDNDVTIICSLIVDKPEFTSQTKSKLKGPKGFKLSLPDKIFNKIGKWKLIETVYNDINRKQLNKMKKTDGSSRVGRITSMSSLQEANWAGKSKKSEAVLLIVEGDSASAYPNRFIDLTKEGRDKYGIFGLGGKILNVMNADFTTIMENTTINNLKKLLGLKEDTDYTLDSNFKKLRYGQIIVMPDADNDGKHILGLLLLFFIHKFPTLLERGDFIKFWRTPIIVVNKGKMKKRFYTELSYNIWKSKTSNFRSWNHHYFKGLGGSDKEDVKDDFNHPKLVDILLDEDATEFMELAFHKDKTNLRKDWLEEYINRQDEINLEDMEEITLSLFVDNELAPYALENVLRAIPEQMDGLKDSQRKVLFGIIERLTKKGAPKLVKTAQVAAYIAERTGYKHGEKSLEDTLIKMVQDFVGSNNLSYFIPKGEFGTRVKGGKDASASRYTWLSLMKWINHVYLPIDRKLLEKRVVDEGEEQECESFFPIIPMHVINGCKGVGTGYSTHIPPYNPLDIIEWLQCRLKDVEIKDIKPYFKGFNGSIEVNDKGFTTKGIYEEFDDKIIVSELPIGRWTDDYSKILDRMIEEGKITNYDDKSSVANPKFIIYGFKGKVTDMKLRLVTKGSFSNMTILRRKEDRKVYPVIFNDIHDLMEDFFTVRYDKYEERKVLQIEDLDKQIKYLSLKAKFILAILEGRLVIEKRPKKDILEDINEMGFLPEFIKLPLSKLTKEGYEKLCKDVEMKEKEKSELNDTSIEDLWYNELEVLKSKL